jgi:hypothetical protein
MRSHSLRRNSSGQVIVITALLVAMVLLSTSVYVIETANNVPKVGSETNDVFWAYQQAAKNALISALANVTNGGNPSVLTRDLDELKSTILSTSFQSMLQINFVPLTMAPYQNGFYISWGTNGQGTSSVCITLGIHSTGTSSTSNSENAICVISQVSLSGSYTLLNGTLNQVNLIVSLLNEGKPALAQNFTFYCADALSSTENWTKVTSPNITDFGNGTYAVLFYAQTDQPTDPVLASVYCQDQRGIILRANVTCSDPSNPDPSTPAPDSPVPAPNLPQAPITGSFPLTGFADDYLMWPNFNGNPSYWNTPLQNVAYAGYTPLQVLSMWHCTGERLFLTFQDDPGISGGASAPQNDKNWGAASTYNYNKLNQVLTLLNSVGVQGILCDYSSEGVNQAGSNWYGSQAWVNSWLNLTTAFKGDTRIKAFELCNEPFSQFWSPTGPTGGVTNLATLDTALKYLIDQIHNIDPQRTIMYPNIVGILASTPTQINNWLNDLDTKSISSYSYVMYDIVHPYYYQSIQGDAITTNWNPSAGNYGTPATDSIANANYLWNNWCTPQINHFGASKCWSGETFSWVRWDPTNSFYGTGQYTDSHISYSGQQLFIKAMINYFVNAGVGFQMLQFMDHIDSYAQKDDLTNSAYQALITQ